MTNTTATKVIEYKIAKLYAAKQEIIDRVKEGVSKSTEKRLDAKFAELDLQQEILEEVLEEIEILETIGGVATEEKAPAQPVDVYVVKDGKKFDGFGKEVKEEAPAVEEAPAAPAKAFAPVAGVTEKEGAVLTVIRETMDMYQDGFSDVMVSDIVEETGYNVKTVKGVLGSLTKKDLVKMADVNDGDYNTFYLTAEGFEVTGGAPAWIA